MIEFDKELNCWWPSEENRKDYAHAYARIGAIDVAMKYVHEEIDAGRQADSYKAIQAGGWMGMWPRYMAEKSYFAKIWSFEPVPYMYEALDANAADFGTNYITTFNSALGPRSGTLALMVEKGGCTSACPSDHPKAKSRQTGTIIVPMVTIDELDLSSCSAIFLDVEHFELEVLAGAAETIRKFSPVLSLEVLKGEDKKVGEWASKNKYRLRERSFNDWILTR